MTKREIRMAELNDMMSEWNCSIREALYEMIFMFYNSVLREECLENELNAMTDEEILEVYLNF